MTGTHLNALEHVHAALPSSTHAATTVETVSKIVPVLVAMTSITRIQTKHPHIHTEMTMTVTIQTDTEADRDRQTH